MNYILSQLIGFVLAPIKKKWVLIKNNWSGVKISVIETQLVITALIFYKSEIVGSHSILTVNVETYCNLNNL